MDAPFCMDEKQEKQTRREKLGYELRLFILSLRLWRSMGFHQRVGWALSR
jgi:hypothetical protein